MHFYLSTTLLIRTENTGQGVKDYILHLMMNNTVGANIYNSLMQIKIPKITTIVTDRPPRVVPVMERGSKWSEIFTYKHEILIKQNELF